LPPPGEVQGSSLGVPRLTLKKRIVLLSFGWFGLVTGLHAWLNVDWASILNDYVPAAKRKFNVAFIPVTCQLTCPVTDYISKYSKAGETFLPRMFQGFPEIKEALISNRIQAALLLRRSPLL
jgi:NitT/TauT family transport system substrate-binding protein